MRLSHNQIEELISASDIVEIISAYTPLKKSGANYMGRCPFHEEKTPSFSVSREKGLYHCFGCGKSGNIFTFLEEKQGMTFIEAAQYLADKYGIKLKFEKGGNNQKHEILYEINRDAARFFYENLNSRAGEYAMEYLHSRNINESSIRKFGLGYSLREKDSLLKKLSDKYSLKDIQSAGLILNIGKDETIDRFRGRLMFPIFNEYGKVIAFAGRIILNPESKNEAKYINSPETLIYNKSRTLYGLNFSRNSIKAKGFVIIVEGYMDLISLSQYGFENVVASSGTAFTDLHAKILSRYTKEAVLFFDSDSAGKNAARRAIEILTENGFSVMVAQLPEGNDPDSFLKKFGKEKLHSIIENRISFIDFIAGYFQNKGKLNTPEGKTELVREIINIISKIKDPIKQNFYIKDISSKFNLDEGLLIKELEISIRKNKKNGKNQTESEKIKSNLSENIPSEEIKLIALFLNADENEINYLIKELTPDIISSNSVKKIINYLMLNIDKGNLPKLSDLMNEYKSEEKLINAVSALLMSDNTLIPPAETLIYRLKINSLEKRKNEINSLLKKSGNALNDSVKQLLSEHQRLTEKIVELKNKNKPV
ncbi:MAG: DNA primase [Ignavibacteria bacterium]|nr:DNA primase [Ignavibacteria bacterium]